MRTKPAPTCTAQTPLYYVEMAGAAKAPPRPSQKQIEKRDAQSKLARGHAQRRAFDATLEGAAFNRTCAEFSAQWRAEADAIEAEKAKR